MLNISACNIIRLYVTIFVFKIGIIEITYVIFFISCQNSGQRFYIVHKNRFSGILRNTFGEDTKIM